MCIIAEHANAQIKIKELEKKIAELQHPVTPEITLLQMPSEQAAKEVTDLALKLMYPCLLDYGSPYYYTNAEGWAEVFNYIYLVYDWPDYITTRMDCEDFGILLKGLVSSLFGLNYFALTIGDVPAGRHGFDFYRDDKGMMIIEPQNAEFFEWKDRGYNPEYALL